MPDPTTAEAPATPPLQRLCAEVIVLRERNDRQHKLFEQTLTTLQDDWRQRFGQFAADTQAAYQRLRDELTGEKRYGLAILSALVDVVLDVQKVTAARPPLAEAARRADSVLAQLGIHRYDVVIGDPYQPALHERIGAKAGDGMGPQRVAAQVEPGYASQQPDFVLRRAKVLISE